ncbi:histidine kinase [Halobacteriales archaeon QS_1_68_17]|nr:MAG: histidine kinase [Halobacteriales archaeon QS_1_68_17]
MSFEEKQNFARQVADLNKYGHALNRSRSAEEVVSLTLEAMELLFEFPYATFVEVGDGELRVLDSTYPELSPGESPSETARAAYERGETVVVEGEKAGIDGDPKVQGTLAAPAEIVGSVRAVLVVRSPTEESFGDEAARPLEILAAHAATALDNIRSRERLERITRDLEKRKEMVEMYDRLLRHDLGNDLQVISAFADHLRTLGDGDAEEYAERISNSADHAIDLIDRIGNLMSTLEEQEEPEPRPLRPVIENAVGTVTDQYESLSVEYDPEAFDYDVFGGDLLERMLTNLLANAAVHNERAVTVRLSVADADQKEVTVTVADDGRGIPEDLHEDLFEMGVKGPDSEGSGFGLGFVDMLLESYGGDIDVGESDAGGATFRLTFERV